MTLKISQSNQIQFQLTTDAAETLSSSRQLSNTVHEIWYLFGYPTLAQQNADISVGNVVAQTGGNSGSVTVLTNQRTPGAPLIPQGGFWVLAKIPTVLEATTNKPVLDANLLNNGFWRLIYDFTANAPVYSRFRTNGQIQIFQNGKLIFNFFPDPNVPLSTPQQNVQNSNAYIPTGVHFDGATGLVTVKPLVTKNTGIISFAGWFNIDPSLNGVLEFSQGNGNQTFFIDASLPAPTWCHIIGTIDSAANQISMLINGSVTGTVGATGAIFNSAPTNGKNLYIGTDTRGNFYKGDIADLAIWFDFSFIVDGAVSTSALGKVVVVNQDPVFGTITIAPILPNMFMFGFNILHQPFQVGVDNVSTVEPPDIFLGGPASTALQPHTQTGTPVQNIHTLQIVSGSLSNSSTNPSKITVVPV